MQDPETTPGSFLLGSRKLGTKRGAYNPGFDCMFRFSRRDKLLVDLAELNHRWFAHLTGVGNLRFLLEVAQNYEFMQTIQPPEAFRNHADAIQRADFIWGLFQELVRYCENYLITDETFSAAATEYSLSQRCAYGSIKKLEKALINRDSYDPAVLESYRRVKRISELARKHPEDWEPEAIASVKARGLYVLLEPAVLGIFLDAACLSSQGGRSCDERFEFILTAAERALKRGLTGDSYRDYYIDMARRAGYPIILDRDLGNPSSFQEYRNRCESIVWSRIRHAKQEKEDDEFMEELWKIYGLILQSRWDTRKTLMNSTEVSVNEIRAREPPAVTAYKKGSAWRLGANPTFDRELQSRWLAFVALAILRNAIFLNETKCPINYIEDVHGKRLCPPADDERCVFQMIKRDFIVKNTRRSNDLTNILDAFISGRHF